jgi:hypothetical protein
MMVIVLKLKFFDIVGIYLIPRLVLFRYLMIGLTGCSWENFSYEELMFTLVEIIYKVNINYYYNKINKNNASYSKTKNIKYIELWFKIVHFFINWF